MIATSPDPARDPLLADAAGAHVDREGVGFPLVHPQDGRQQPAVAAGLEDYYEGLALLTGYWQGLALLAGR